MKVLLENLLKCIEFGKVNLKSPFPASMKGLEGADELTKSALERGISAQDILDKALIPGMNNIGVKFSENKVFVPEMLMAAKAMTTAMAHLQPYFLSGEVKRKGVFVIGTVHGDLHDIGKNLLGMTIKGAGWEVVDLGVDVSAEKFMEAIDKFQGCLIGLSALLTTTMSNMENIVRRVKEKSPATKVLVGGAPLNKEFCNKIGADFYSKDPQGAIEYLNQLVISN